MNLGWRFDEVHGAFDAAGQRVQSGESTYSGARNRRYVTC
jgi:hypothetical protein